jgi:hypothetical protein
MPLRPEAEPVSQHEACCSFCFLSLIIRGYPSGMMREKNNHGHSKMLMRFYICMLNKGTCKYTDKNKQGFIYISSGQGLTCIYMMWIVGNVCFWACKKLVAMVAEIQLVNIVFQGIED